MTDTRPMVVHPPIPVASVSLPGGHAIRVTVETRRGHRIANLRLWSPAPNARSGVRAILATRKAFAVDAASLPGLATAINAAFDAIIAEGVA